MPTERRKHQHALLAGLLALIATITAAIAIATGSPDVNAASPIAAGATATPGAGDGGQLAKRGGRPGDGGPRDDFGPGGGH
jgi:hypothetical protein